MVGVICLYRKDKTAQDELREWAIRFGYSLVVTGLGPK